MPGGSNNSHRLDPPWPAGTGPSYDPAETLRRRSTAGCSFISSTPASRTSTSSCCGVGPTTANSLEPSGFTQGREIPLIRHPGPSGKHIRHARNECGSADRCKRALELHYDQSRGVPVSAQYHSDTNSSRQRGRIACDPPLRTSGRLLRSAFGVTPEPSPFETTIDPFTGGRRESRVCITRSARAVMSEGQGQAVLHGVGRAHAFREDEMTAVPPTSLRWRNASRVGTRHRALLASSCRSDRGAGTAALRGSARERAGPWRALHDGRDTTDAERARDRQFAV